MNKNQNPLVVGLENACNLTTTENGALAYKSTLNSLLDFFGNAGAMRTRSDSDVINLFSKAFAEDRLLALKTLFYIRDSRGGQGERKVFRTILTWLAKNYPEIVEKNILGVPFYGRWDDLYCLFGTPLEDQTIRFMFAQLSKDLTDMKKGNAVSLLAKWMKSENTSSKESVALARKFREFLGWSSKKYRKTLSALRRYIDVVEVKMCAGEFDQIKFGQVPSRAHANYKKAFERQSGAKYTEYLNKVEKGEDKINAGALFPYDILRSVVEGQLSPTALKAADLQWKALPNYVEEGGNGICICDVSGSMSGLPLYISVSLGIYFAERNVGPFKDVFMTFSNTPQFHRIIGNNLLEKWNNFDRTGWDMNTDLIKSFKLILDTAVKYQVKPEDMPSKVFCISDMEFDACSSGFTNFDEIDTLYKRYGYKRPSLIFWNVESRNTQNPIRYNDENVCLVSGASPSILKSICGKKILSPMEVMLETITNKRYDSIVV